MIGTLRCTVPVILLLVCSRPSLAQVVTSAPDGVEGVGFDDRSGDRLPLSESFVDSSGVSTVLGNYFDGERPVILTFNYSDCPMLCKLQLNGLVESLKQIDWDAGDQFRVVSISIDPSETPQQAAAIRQSHLQAYGRRNADDGWVFLTGSPESIRKTADAAGFFYKFIPRQREFSHTAAVILCSPEGMITRYLYGVQYDPETLRLSLAEAAEGKIGSPLDRLLLFCFRYDAATGKYAPAAWNLMRIGALTTVVLLGIFILRFRFALHPQRSNSATAYNQT